MSYRVFTYHELYNMLCAQYSALKLEAADGKKNAEFYLAPEYDYEENLEALGSHKQEFDKDLYKAAKVTESDFDKLISLSDTEYSTDDSFFGEVEDSKDSIMDKALSFLDKYMLS